MIERWRGPGKQRDVAASLGPHARFSDGQRVSASEAAYAFVSRVYRSREANEPKPGADQREALLTAPSAIVKFLASLAGVDTSMRKMAASPICATVTVVDHLVCVTATGVACAALED